MPITTEEGSAAYHPRWRARAAFALLFIGFCTQLLVARTIDEPYPALFQPSFAGTPLKDGELTAEVPKVTVQFTDGDTEEIDYRDVLPPSRLHPLVVFRSAFGEPDAETEDATVDWLSSRMQTRYGERVVDAVLVEWFEVSYRSEDSWAPRAMLDRTVEVRINGSAAG